LLLLCCSRLLFSGEVLEEVTEKEVMLAMELRKLHGSPLSVGIMQTASLAFLLIPTHFSSDVA
jgi:hypothetical protein